MKRVVLFGLVVAAFSGVGVAPAVPATTAPAPTSWLQTRGDMDSFLPSRFKNIETAFCVPDETSASKLFGTTLWWQAFWCTGRTYGGAAYHLLAQVKGSCDSCWTIDDLQGADPAGLTTRQFASASASTASTAADRPEVLFPVVASGMLQIVSTCSSGVSYYGSGFLIGPETIVTALHVLRPPGLSCSNPRGKQQGTNRVVRITNYEPYLADDLAIAHLSAPLSGFFFSFAPTAPPIGAQAISLGYSLTNPLSLNQGSVLLAPLEVAGVPRIVLDLLGAGGASGGPILDAVGQVFGLNQDALVSRTVGEIESIDLPLLVHGGLHLCDAFAQASPTTLCRTVAPGLLPSLSSSGQNGSGAATWPPAGYDKWAGSLYFRWDQKTACSPAATDGCWTVDVISKSGCAEGVVVTLDEDRGKYVYGTVINSVASLAARTPAAVEIDGDQKGNFTGQLLEITCL